MFDDTPMRFTLAQKRECIAREIRQREHVYPRRISDGKMSPAKAEYELACMRAIGTDYERYLTKYQMIALCRKWLIATKPKRRKK